MSRSVTEWVGKRDDTAIPARVKDRVAQGSEDCCVKCARKVGGALRAEFDHAIPLILGGNHRESNLQLLCHECHGAKTKLDVKIKAKVARVRARNLGLKKPARGFYDKSKFKMKIGGGLVDRRTGQPIRFNRGYAMEAQIGHNSQPTVEASATSFSRDQLKAIIERIERLEEEKKAISDDIKDVYAEAKGNGFDVKALRTIVRLRKEDADKRQEYETILETYLMSLGMI